MPCYRLEIRGKSVTATTRFRVVKANALAYAEELQSRTISVKVFALPHGKDLTGGTEIASFPAKAKKVDPLAGLDL